MAVGIFAGIRVGTFQTAVEWYQRLLGAPPSLYPHDTEAVWQLSENCHVYVVEDPTRAGRGSCMIWVDDPVTEVASIAARGLDPVDVEKHDRVWKYVFHDPDGNETSIGGEVSPPQ